MKVLGLKVIGHDTGAAIVDDSDGVVKLMAISEERLNRVKHTTKFPIFAIGTCLEQAGIGIDDLDAIVFNHRRNVYKLQTFFDFKSEFDSSRYDSYIGKSFKWPDKKVHIINHHDCHGASAYFCSPFDKATILVVDASGNEGESQSIYAAEGSDFNLLDRSYKRGIGALYEAVTNNILGFKGTGSAGKTMGLSAYGGKYSENDLSNKLQAVRSGIDLNYNHILDETDTEFLLKTEVKICDNKQDILNSIYSRVAFDIQKEAERQMLYLVNLAWEMNPCENLCIAGGVGLNCVANEKIKRYSKFKNIWIQPASDDSGIPLGAALYGYNKILKSSSRYRMKSAAIGFSYTKVEIQNLLDRFNINYIEITNKELADKISKGDIVGWFTGSSEYGPRALGFRSILCDPRKIENKDILNKRVKHREIFRPFAPVVKLDKANRFFDVNDTSPFMLFAKNVIEEVKTQIPAVVHFDGTARIQTVDKNDNSLLYDLLDEFEKITNVPVLLNTSFNDNQEPIVESPLDALICFYTTELDGLYLQGYYVKKEDNVDILDKLKNYKKSLLIQNKYDFINKYCYIED
ncbi:carbamoyltransferase [Abyssisolibacter fermentans]|uniref:carbamoyltransferase family protein n=1 Tax=Abyssisolibacter fermentans TaxID=1766203 RepID=UPI00082971CD|nr:carbamoyltransferase C-terminal domain-containing protein [Abyssisolibacter fermentans]